MPAEFSVIVPTLGDSPHLRAALGSALAAPVELELLLVLDPAGPKTRPPIDDRRVRVVEAEAPGPAATRNAGLDAAEGRWVALLDDDDAWLPDHLPRCRALLERRADAVLAATNAWLFVDPSLDGSGVPPSALEGLATFQDNLGEDDLDLDRLVAANRILTPTVVLRRELLGPEDRFDPSLPVMEDYELWLRLAARHRLVYDPHPSVVVRRRPGSASGDPRAMAEGSLEILARLERSGVPIPPRRRGRLYKDLAWACLAQDDGAGARRAARQALGALPLDIRSYIYLITGTLPGPVRRRIFPRGPRRA